jgi:hypothetical protein
MKIFNSLKKFWNKLFAKKVVNYPTNSSPISPATILEVLKLAKEMYLNRNLEFGMCFCIHTNLCRIVHKPLINDYEYLSKYIPEFNPEFLNGDPKCVYWWPLNDVKSRIKAFDKLISIYENKNSQ